MGDVNGDGWLDIVGGSYTSIVSVLLGQLGGTFGAAANYSTAANSVTLGDANGDGRLDLVTTNGNQTNASNATVSVLLGLSGGGFGPRTEYATGQRPNSVAVGDLNGDGRPDLATSNYYDNTVSVLLGLPGGGYAPHADYPVGTFPSCLALGDLNGDGRLDVVTTTTDRTNSTGIASVLLGGASGLGTKTDYAVGASPNGIALGDVNGDGRLDIITSNYIGNSISALLRLPAGGFGPKADFAISSSPNGVALGDINGDGRPDIVTASNLLNAASVLLNTGTYTPLATAPTAAAEVALYPNPAHDTFRVQLPAGLVPTQAELLDALGQVVRRPAIGSSSFRVETSGLAPGLYTLRLRAGGTALARRVVVE
ncbi:hypothetical protein GCM10027345_09890 [Hymenobacter daeguensis]